MKKNLLVLITFCAGFQPATAQMEPTCVLIEAGFSTTSWGGVTETMDGGVAFTGLHQIANNGITDLVVTKLDEGAALQWIKTYSTGDFSSEYGLAIITTNDGGMAVAGYLDIGEVFIMKLNSDGEQQWAKSYDAPGFSGLDISNAFTQLPDGGYALICRLGFISNDNWLMLRTESDGDVLWSDRLDYTGGFPMDVAALPNGDLIFIGDAIGDSTPSLVLRKNGLSGATQWMYWYSAEPEHGLTMQSVVTLADSTIIVAGYGGPFGPSDALALALSPAGEPLWATRIGTDDIEYGENIAIATNGDLILAGARLQEVSGPNPPIGRFVVRLNPNGQYLWSKNVSHPDATNNLPVRCAAASDGGLLLTGAAGTSTNILQSFMKLDSEGNTCSYCPSINAGVPNEMVITQAADQGFAFIGPWATATDFTFIVTDITASVSSAICGTTGLEEELDESKVSIAPNPFVDQTTLTVNGVGLLPNATLELRDVLGRAVLVQNMENHTTIINRNALASGHYIYRVISNGEILARGAIQVVDR